MGEDRGLETAPTETRMEALPGEDDNEVHSSRLQLVWDVILFQFKLLFDGLRDLLLSPISIVAAVLGLVAGGNDPHQYFRRLMAIGRRSEAWINLFGRRHRGTSDELIDPLRQRLFDEARDNPWISRAGARLNERLDRVNAPRESPPDDPRGD